MKPFKSLDEQVDILEERGLKISDRDDAKKYLLQNNYYNVVNMYSKLFQENENTFSAGTNFNEIKSLHIFDTEIKALFLKHTLIAEKHFKSIYAYYFAEKYHKEKLSFLKTSNYPTDNILELTNTFSQIARRINQSLKDKNGNAIKHNKRTYDDIPIWVVINDLTLGNVINLYKNTDDKTRNQVAIELSNILYSNINKTTKLEPDYINKMLYNILDIRNCVAHNNKFLGFKCRNNLKYIEVLHKELNIDPRESRQSPYHVLIILKCFLPFADYALLHNSLRKRTFNLSRKINRDTLNRILESYGFPENWHENVSKINQN